MSFIYDIFPGFVCFVLYLANISGERLQDHWSSGLGLTILYVQFDTIKAQLVNLNVHVQEASNQITQPIQYTKRKKIIKRELKKSLGSKTISSR